jgi:hypothetical protein
MKSANSGLNVYKASPTYPTLILERYHLFFDTVHDSESSSK